MEQAKELSTKEKQELILGIMKDVDKFCRANDIPYTLSSGTLLGAVRHKGFIPWDDDADIFMLREDFERFAKIYKSDKYRLDSSVRTADGYKTAGYLKISDPKTVIRYSKKESDAGIFLDVFPLDSVPEDEKECKKYMHRLMSLYNRIYHRQRTDFVSILKSYRHSLKWWCRRLDRAVHEGKYADSPLVAHAVGTRNYRTVIRRDRFKTLVDTPFEGHNFLGFSDPGSYLTIVYGEDYMTPKQWSHNFKAYIKEDEQ